MEECGREVQGSIPGLEPSLVKLLRSLGYTDMTLQQDTHEFMVLHSCIYQYIANLADSFNTSNFSVLPVPRT